MWKLKLQVLGSQKSWRRPNLREWLVGIHYFFVKDGNAIGLQRLVNNCKQANKKR
jgi:hypothetical protein